MRKDLFDRGSGSKADWLNALEALKAQQVVLATDQSQQQDNASAIEVLHQSAVKARTGFLSDYGQKLEAAQKDADQLADRLHQVQVVLDAMTLSSPADGIVQASSVTTLGQVVTAGQELLRVVPSDAQLDVEAFLPNDQAGFVEVGQAAEVKVTAFPFTQYGTIQATVTKVGRDALSQSDATAEAADPTRSGSPTIPGSADGTSGLVFPITVQLASASILADGKAAALTPGMTVTVEINTGSRTILQYLFSPLVDVGATALRER